MEFYFKSMAKVNKGLIKAIIEVMNEGFNLFNFVYVMIGIAVIIIYNAMLITMFVVLSIIFAARMLLSIPIGIARYGKNFKPYVIGFAEGFTKSISKAMEKAYNNIED